MVLVWASQFLSIMGFSFALPFVAFFLQEDLGVTRPAEVRPLLKGRSNWYWLACSCTLGVKKPHGRVNGRATGRRSISCCSKAASRA